MDRIGATAMLLFGLFWAWVASGMDMRTRDGGPGPGVLPLALGVMVAVLAAINAVRPEVERIELPHLGRIGVILATLIGYALLLEPLGYILATTLLLGVLFVAFAERRRWWQPVSALAVALGTFYVFRVLLQMPLPLDPLELVY